jgi:hypothetical protein
MNNIVTNQMQQDTGFMKLHDYAEVKNQLGFMLINFEKNKELLEKVPYIKFLNLAVIAFINESITGGISFLTLVYTHYIEKWGVKREQLIRDAMCNMFERIPAIMGTAAGIRDRNPDLGNIYSLYILTNSSEYLGAGSILYPDVLQRCAKKLGKEYYLLPVGVHEMFSMSKYRILDPVEELYTMRQINETNDIHTEILSDQIYRYDSDTNTIHMLDIELNSAGKEKAVVIDSVCMDDFNNWLLLKKR